MFDELKEVKHFKEITDFKRLIMTEMFDWFIYRPPKILKFSK